ncbi:MAG: hypothetical protein U1F61_03435 [Opitutaceae bacterium]
MKDRSAIGQRTLRIRCWERVNDIAKIIHELKRQAFSGWYVIEYESNPETIRLRWASVPRFSARTFGSFRLPMNPPAPTCRAVLKSGLAAAACWALPRFSIAQGEPQAGRKLNLAFIGVGGIGGSALSGCDGHYVAFCDVDEARAAGNYAKYPGVPQFRDFRA